MRGRRISQAVRVKKFIFSYPAITLVARRRIFLVTVVSTIFARILSISPSPIHLSLTSPSPTARYVTELKVEGGDVVFFLPTAVAPRYNPASEKDLLLQTGSLAEGSRGLSVTARMHMASAITSVRSETHAIKFTSDGSVDGTVTFAQPYTHLEKDLVLLVATALPHAPRLCVETGADGSRAVMLTLVPSFDVGTCKCEFIFLVDRSGSMGGEKIKQAGRAMQVRQHTHTYIYIYILLHYALFGTVLCTLYS